MASNIFTPRKAFDNKGVEIDYISPTGPKEYDKYYIKRQVKFVPVPVQEGSDEFVLDMKVIDDKEDIAMLLSSQASGVGIEALMEKFNRTGDPSVLPPQMVPTDEVMDFTKLPQDNAEYFEYIHGLASAFESLPVELRKDMTAEEFVRQVTQKQVYDYVSSLVDKKEVIKDE